MLGHFGMIPLTNYDYSEGEQWGRYNLPRYIIKFPWEVFHRFIFNMLSSTPVLWSSTSSWGNLYRYHQISMWDFRSNYLSFENMLYLMGGFFHICGMSVDFFEHSCACWLEFFISSGYRHGSLRSSWQELTKTGMLQIPSGKRLHNYGKSPFFMGKSTINGHFQ